MSPEPVAISFQAIFSKANTTVDGGWNLTLSVAATQGNEVLALSALRDCVLQCAFVPIPAVDSEGMEF